MKVTPKLIKQVVHQVVGEDVIPLLVYLRGKKNISEFEIAENIDIEVNEARNMLYRLHGHHLVTYHRKKDREKGWYISYWTFNPQRVLEIREKLHEESISRLKERLKREEDNLNAFFMCTNLCARLTFDHAIDFEFKCPECGVLMNQQDNTKTIEHLRGRIQDAMQASGVVNTHS